MNITDFQLIEKYMLECMQDSAHDKEHLYRVLYVALDIAEQERHVDCDVLIAACLLHDIGRQEQFENPSLCHAVAGAEKARNFLLEKGFPEKFADKVSSCIKVHRFRSCNPPVKTEEKILSLRITTKPFPSIAPHLTRSSPVSCNWKASLRRFWKTAPKRLCCHESQLPTLYPQFFYRWIPAG